MRRLIGIAAAIIFALSLPLAAQRGGHASGGGHAGFSGHAGFGGGRSLSGAHAGSGPTARSRSFARSYSNRTSGGRQNSNYRNRNSVGLRIRTYGRGNRSNRRYGRNGFGYGRDCYGFGYGCGAGYGYPYLGGGVDPFWWWNSDSSYDQDQENQIGLANEMNEQSLSEQSTREQASQVPYADAAPPQPPQHHERTEVLPATVLVFHDQHKVEVENYAIVGEILFAFAPQRTQKIPLTDLDIPATTKANEDRGVDFRVPVTQGKLSLQFEYRPVAN